MFKEVAGFYIILPVTLIFAILASAGNILVFIVIMRHESLRSQSAYRFIASLNIADILVGMLAQPLYTAIIISGGGEYCWMERAAHFVGSVSSAASGIGLVCVSMDRYIYITKPLHYQEIMTEKRVIVALIYPWTVAVFSAFMPYITGVKAFHIFLFIAMFLDTAVMAFFYITILKVVRGKVSDSDQPQGKRQSQATKTIAFVVLAYGICWLPFVTVSFVWSLNIPDHSPGSALVSAYYWTLALGHWNSAMNVTIYGWKNTELREAAKKFVGFKSQDTLVSVSFGREKSNENSSLKDKPMNKSMDKSMDVISVLSHEQQREIPTVKNRHE